MINTSRCTVKLVDSRHLRNRPRYIIQARRIGTTEALLRLPGGKRIDRVVRVGKSGAGRIVNGIAVSRRGRQVHIPRPDEVLAVYVQIRNAGGESLAEFALNTEATLLHLWS